jgi:SNF2 family DNA or RNA helicase
VTDPSAISKLHEVLKPYLLRRVKADVEKNLPPREETLIEVEQTPMQAGYYKAVFEKNVDYLMVGWRSSVHLNLHQ